MPENPLSDEQVRQELVPGEPGDDLLMNILTALRANGTPVEVLEVYGVGPEEAAAVTRIDGRQMRITAAPW